jgi:hypothetical protein
VSRAANENSEREKPVIRHEEYIPNGAGLFGVGQANGHEVITNIRRLAGHDWAPGSRVIAFATWLLVLLGAGLMYVSFAAQYQYIYAVKRVNAASAIEAAMLDAGMIILSALGIGLALAGKPSKAERFLIMVCAGLSAFMNYAAADAASWRSVVAFVAAPVFLAVIVDRVISVIRRHVLPDDAESAWAGLGRVVVHAAGLLAIVVLYALRTVLAPKETARGLRRMVLDAAPVPGVIEVAAEQEHPEVTAEAKPELPPGLFFAPHGGAVPHLTLNAVGQLEVCDKCPEDEDELPGPDQEPEIEFATKKQAFLSLYRGHSRYGDRSAAGRVAAELAPKAGLQVGTGRTYIAEELRRLDQAVEARASGTRALTERRGSAS